MQQAKLRQDEETVKEIMARTGMDYATAKMTLAHIPLLQAQAQKARQDLDPLYKDNALFNAYQNAPQGSDQKIFYQGLLAQDVGKDGLQFLSAQPIPGQDNSAGGVSSPGATQTLGSPAGSPGGSAPNGGFDINPIGGGPRSVFHQAYLDTPNNPSTTGESPTSTSASRNQNRAEATSELDYIGPIMKKGFDPYMGPLGSTKLMYDSTLASTSPNSASGKAAAERLYNYSLANRFKREAANIISRQSSGEKPGVEAAREQEQSSFGNLPGRFSNYFIPNSIQNQSFSDYFPTQSEMAAKAMDQERQGYTVPGEAPFWSGSQAPQVSRGFLGVPTGMRYPSPAQPNSGNKSKTQNVQGSRTINGVEYVKVNGKWHTK